RLAEDAQVVHFPATTALGALGRYISSSEAKNYQPANIAFGLLPPLAQEIRDKRKKKEALVARALRDHDAFAAAQALAGVPAI
ncbi:MAG TPA: methylenetetrahydrofolate--tRNA-(uracil(54)-C(5))-methyltransferase (FADH(2)-oxidizing) TrmFO, partial [Candidatus Polarisedimenticolia bacterium]|nr:methylenetetrahydrofolate--tRNA-(uracil(54)-C(5))-methyltransferase (FADH(2)-oxidizing) TrmFO [Candidatus Polarisedimenticolia bacterium]